MPEQMCGLELCSLFGLEKLCCRMRNARPKIFELEVPPLGSYRR